MAWLVAPGLGAHDFGGTVVIVGRMVERRVGFDIECNVIVCWREVVVSMLFQDNVVGMMSRDIVVVGRLYMMAWFDTWNDR